MCTIQLLVLLAVRAAFGLAKCHHYQHHRQIENCGQDGREVGNFSSNFAHITRLKIFCWKIMTQPRCPREKTDTEQSVLQIHEAGPDNKILGKETKRPNFYRCSGPQRLGSEGDTSPPSPPCQYLRVACLRQEVMIQRLAQCFCAFTLSESYDETWIWCTYSQDCRTLLSFVQSYLNLESGDFSLTVVQEFIFWHTLEKPVELLVSRFAYLWWQLLQRKTAIVLIPHRTDIACYRNGSRPQQVVNAVSCDWLGSWPPVATPVSGPVSRPLDVGGHPQWQQGQQGHTGKTPLHRPLPYSAA